MTSQSAPAPEDGWRDALIAGRLLAIDPAGLGGAVLRGEGGMAREGWLAWLREALPPGSPLRRLPHGMGDDALLGGLDLVATVQAGQPMVQRGALAAADGGLVVLGMAERATPLLAARLASVLDNGEVALQRDGLSLCLPARIGLVALDDGLGEEERPPAALADRLAFHLDLTAMAARATAPVADAPRRVMAARAALASVVVPAGMVATLCEVALALGIVSLRAPILTLRAAVALAAWQARGEVGEADLATAARLVLAPRATAVPPAGEEAEPPPPSPSDAEEARAEAGRPLEDVVLEAVRAVLPADLLAGLSRGLVARRGRTDGRVGVARQSRQRGRPIGALAGDPRQGGRLHLLETLKAAAPWQRLRPPVGEGRLALRRSDFRIRRFRQHSESLTIFAVDASGSSALHRLAEAKGAIELLLAECYVRRDKVALIGFRGSGAMLLLPPTGALARARGCLAGMAGGGGTPLAAGIDAAAGLAAEARRRGQSPTIALLTDGRANVAADGTQDRARAQADAQAAARRVRAEGFAVLLIDTAPRPDARVVALGRELGARYLALPQAGARELSAALRAGVA